MKTSGASGTLPVADGAAGAGPGGKAAVAGGQADGAPAGMIRVAAASGSQVAIVDPAGRAIAGATVTIGQLRLTADENGLVELPAAPAGGQPPLAIIEAPGRVPRSTTLTAGFGLALDAIDGQATALTATAGGIAKNADDTMRVSFAPGALSKDGPVHVTRIYGDTAASLAALAPHVRETVDRTFAGRDLAGAYTYHLDLPEGHLAPGADVTVDFKVEPKLRAYLEEMSKVPGWLEKGELKDTFRRDPSGGWWFSMKVPSPPAPVAAAGPKGYKLKAAACATHNDIETYYVPDQRPAYRDAVRQETGTRVVQEWRTGWTSRPVQHCDPIPGGVAVHDPSINGGGCFYTQSCPDIVESYNYLVDVVETFQYDVWYKEMFWEAFMRAEQRPWRSQSINARVSYQSDDPRFAGRPIPGLLVNFSHAGTPMRGPILGGYTGGDGIATGEGQAGTPGRAVAQATEPYTFSTAAGYAVDCGTVDLQIVKNRPRVNLKGNARGQAIGAGLELPTPLGAAAITPGQTSTWTPGIDGSSYQLAIGGTRQLSQDGWLDYDGPATTIHWNGSHDVGVDLWYSRTATASARWVSDDASVPAEQRPTTTWHDQAVARADYTFAHAVSGSPKKPSGRDLLGFGDAENATAWGLSGAEGTVTVVPAPSAITLRGEGKTVLNGGSSVVDVEANLPKVTFTLSGGVPGEYTMAYKLTRSDGQTKAATMKVNFVGSSATVSLPIEDPVGKGFTHTFKLEHMRRGDFANVMTLPNGSLNFPTLDGLKRGLKAPLAYTPILSTFVTAK